MAFLDTVSMKVTNYIIDIDDTIQEKETIEYGVYMFLSESIKIIAVCILACALGLLGDIIFIMVVLGVLRNYMGGIHAKTQWGCFLSYISILSVIYLLGNVHGTAAVNTVIIMLYPLNLWAIHKYAPADTEYKPILSEKIYCRFRKNSLMLFLIIYDLFLILPEPFNLYVGLCVTSEAFLITPVAYKLYGTRYGRRDLL